MQKHEQFMADLRRLTTTRLGFDGSAVEQGSDEWQICRTGVITASKAGAIIASGRKAGTYGAARQTALLELIAEVATGRKPESGSFKQTEWGHEHEESSRQIFSFHVGTPVHEVPFIYGDDTMRYGCSPDGIADDHSGIEIKSPWTTPVYLDFLLNGEIKPEYLMQCQFSMFVTGLPYWHFANYDPRMSVKSFHSVLIERDEALMKTFADAVGQMVHDMDLALMKLGLQFGDQWPKPAPAVTPVVTPEPAEAA